MQWKKAKQLRPSEFKRLVGVNRETFDRMVSEAIRLTRKPRSKKRGKKRGRKEKLSKQDQILMLLMYYREYRPFFHTGSSFGISETQCWRIITRLEQLLIKSNLFHIPGKKRLMSDIDWKVILVDVSEHPIERPKKNNEDIIQEKRKDIR